MTASVQDVKNRMKKTLGNVQKKMRGGNAKFFQFRECKKAEDKGNLIRIIYPPYFDPAKHDVILATQKYNLEMDGFKWGLDVYCPHLYGEPDPINKKREELLASGSEEAAQELAPRDEYLMLGVDVETLEGLEEGVQVFKFSNACATALMDVISDEDIPGLVYDLQKGRNIRVRRVKAVTGFTEYKAKPLVEAESLLDVATNLYIKELKLSPQEAKDKAAAWLKDTLEQASKVNLTRFVKIETEEVLEGILRGEYDKEEAREARKERDQALGHPVTRYVLGEEYEPGPFEEEADEEVSATPASTSTISEPSGGTSTQKAATASSAQRETRKSSKVGTSKSTDGTATANSATHSLTELIGQSVSFRTGGKLAEGKVLEVTKAGGKEMLVIDYEGEPSLLDPKNVVTGAQAEVVSEEEKKSYADKIRQLAD